MRTIILSAFLAVSMNSAAAQECDPDDGSQIGMNICADAGYKAADKKLNATYGEIMARFEDDADARMLLQTSQREWIGFRDAECAFAASGV